MMQRDDDLQHQPPVFLSPPLHNQPPPDAVKLTGVPFAELVDRLLALKMSRADNHFADVFLCLYRKFAAPGELLTAILSRLDSVREDESMYYLSKMATQLRIVEVVAKWVSLYPGDFARPLTRRNLVDFIGHLSTEPIFFLAAQQMRQNLGNITEDDDTGWAKSDDIFDSSASGLVAQEPAYSTNFTGFGGFNLCPGPGLNLGTARPGSSNLHHFNSSINMNVPDCCKSPQMSASASVSTLAAATSHDMMMDLDGGSAYSTHFKHNPCDEYEREAALYETVELFDLSKTHFKVFMDTPDDVIAQEMTHIDWIMFSSIRIRDLVRHVSLSSEEKDKCRSLTNVNRMIAHFNRVALWTTSMILFREKAKHRALCLEKLMCVASKLRIMNNYNSLAAVLAGINSTPIHRLAATRSLVSPEVQKRYARLSILMGVQKGHFSYRLAWENSSYPRIPFMPLHRRDLVSVEEGGKTLVGVDQTRINWRKFEVLGDVLLPIMKSQGTPYPATTRHDAVREVLLNCRLQWDDEVSFSTAYSST